MKRILFFLLTTAAVTSCGSSIGQEMTYFCCPRNVMQFYVCPDQDSFTQCWNQSDPSSCTADPTRNIGCPAIWPSGPPNEPTPAK